VTAVSKAHTIVSGLRMYVVTDHLIT
jgi:hypothetical protein